MRCGLTRLNAYSWGLIFFAQIAISRGLLYSVARESGTSSFILDKIGNFSWFYAFLWGLIGFSLLVQALRGKRANLAMVCLTGLLVCWGVFYLLSGFENPGYVLAADFFLAMAGLAGVFTKLMAMPRFRGGK